MATYKVIQDIEAEDKLLGPLTLRQFIYAAVAGVCIWLSVISYMKGVPFMMALLSPVALLAGFLAFPWGGDQPTEVWAVSKLRFFLKPRKRIWDQSGQKELVNITVPKKVERRYTDGLSEAEVKSRLSALADTLDTRGWALQNQPHEIVANQQGDRLFGVTATLPQPVIQTDTRPSDDIFDRQAPVAHHLNELVNSATQQRREALLARLDSNAPYEQPPVPAQAPSAPSSDWFSPRENTTEPTDEPAASKPVEPPNQNLASSTPSTHTQNPQTQATSTAQTAIMDLVGNDDLDIATLSRQANQRKALGEDVGDDGEVVVPLR